MSPTGPVTKNIFYSRTPETALNGIFSNFLSYWKISDLHLVLEDFHMKKCIKELCKK